MRSYFCILFLLIGVGCLSPPPQESPLPKVSPSPTLPTGTIAPMESLPSTPLEIPSSISSHAPQPPLTAAPTPVPPPETLVPETPAAGPLLVERLRSFSNLTFYLPGDHFRAEYRIRNMGNVTIENITAEISFSSDNLRPVLLAYEQKDAPHTQVIASLDPGEERQIFWLIYAWKSGDGDVLLEVRSAAGVQRLSFSVRVG